MVKTGSKKEDYLFLLPENGGDDPTQNPPVFLSENPVKDPLSEALRAEAEKENLSIDFSPKIKISCAGIFSACFIGRYFLYHSWEK